MGSELDALIDQLDSLSLKNVFYVYDEEMTKHMGDKHHPERPDRIRTIHDHFDQLGLLKKLHVLSSREATARELALAHTEELVSKVSNFTSESGLTGGPEDPLVKQKQYLFPFDHDTYVCHSTPRAAQLACGSVLNLVDSVMENVNGTGFAAIRPPGHHACREKSMGFCLFNNVAVAAEYAKEKFNLARIAIIDWDVHHCNGTSEIFSSRDDVLVISIHRYDRGKFYPGTGHLNDIGSYKGKGFNINLPIDGSYGDEEILYVWNQVVLPAIAKFKPQLVLVSAGFDAAENDPLGQCRVSCSTYGVLVKQLLARLNEKDLFPISQGRVALVLEGGYNLTSIAAASVACVQSLLNMEYEFHSIGVSSPSSSDASSSVSSVRSVPSGLPKTSVVKMVHDVTKLIKASGSLDLEIAPDVQARKPVPAVIHEKHESLLTSGGGHPGGVIRNEKTTQVEKKTTVREALCYALIAEALDRPLDVVVEDQQVSWTLMVEEEKRRINFASRIEDFKTIGEFTCECVRIMVRSENDASIVLSDLTHGLAQDATLGVLDIKLGTQYHLPEDSPGRVQTRRQKALSTSASSLGIRLTACRCLDGFTVGKHKARKLKLMEQMVPVVRRFMYSSVENFDKSVETAHSFSNRLVETFDDSIELSFIASSALFVIGTNVTSKEVELRCKLIDLAHMYAMDETENGFVLGCKNLVTLFQESRAPSYESA